MKDINDKVHYYAGLITTAALLLSSTEYIHKKRLNAKQVKIMQYMTYLLLLPFVKYVFIKQLSMLHVHTTLNEECLNL